MENSTPKSIFVMSKKMVAILNQAKMRTFGDKSELKEWLKKAGCPFSQDIVPYLYRTQEIKHQGDFIVFANRTPFYFGDFISIIERLKKQKSKYNHVYAQKKKSCDCGMIKTKEHIIEEVKEDKPIIPSIPFSSLPFSKWNKFWLKFFFGITI